jgi:large subunit ribosomal protein L28
LRERRQYWKLTFSSKTTNRSPALCLGRFFGLDPKFQLDEGDKATDLPGSSRRGLIMARECSITGAKPAKGHVIHRRGMAKKKGGVGQHVTANTPRLFTPNLKTKRIWVPELTRFVTVKLSARALKTITKNGAFKTLKKAGLV